MIRGVTVQVNRPYQSSTDRFNNVVYGMTGESIGNVLIHSGSSEDLDASRPEGVSVEYTLRLPNTFYGSLEGCSVELPAPWSGTFDVIGDITYLIPENTPTHWNGVVEVGHAHG